MNVALRLLRAGVIALAIGFLGQIAQAEDLPSACSVDVPVLQPVNAPDRNVTLVCHAAYAALVDDVALVPRWVSYRLTGDHTLGCIPRTDNFHPDEGLQPGHRAKPADYAKSGYDIGHQAPAQDFAWDAGAMSDSFSLANMAPQLPGLNRYGWERLEETVRAWAWQRGELQIYVGPIIGPDDAKIEHTQVDIPSGFWKVLVDVKTGEAIGFEMPQKDIAKGDLTPFQVSIGKIEADAGVSLPLPAAVDRGAVPQIWSADLAAWSKAHKKRCHN